jgi:predicted amidohydrolase
MKFKLALAQIDPVLGDLRKNIDKHLEYIARAKKEGADLVVFPELSLTGYTVRDMNTELAINLDGDTSLLKPLIEASRGGVSIIAGAIEEGSNFGIYNAAFLFEDGEVRSVHRKIYPPTYGMFDEMRYFSPGEAVQAFNSKLGRFGVLICEDLWHMSLPYILAMDGSQVIIALVASPTRIGPDEPDFEAPLVNAENHRTYARLLSVYVSFCNRVGHEDGMNFWGASHVVSPDGELIARARPFEEDLLLTAIEEGEIRRARRLSRHFLDERVEIMRAYLRM